MNLLCELKEFIISVINRALSDLRECLVIESPLKTMNNAFYFRHFQIVPHLSLLTPTYPK